MPTVRRTLDCIADTGSFFVEEVGNPANSASYSVGLLYPNSYVSGIRFETGWSLGADCYVDELTVTGEPIPEPATLSLGLMGLCSVGWYLRKRLGH